MNRSEWEHLTPKFERYLENGTITMIIHSSDGALKVSQNLGGYRGVSIYAPGSAGYEVLQELIGPTNPGDIKEFNRLVVQPPETDITPEVLHAFIFDMDAIESIEVLQNGKVRLTDRRRYEGNDITMEFLGNGSHFDLLDRHFGPLTPGLKIEIPTKDIKSGRQADR